MALDWRPHGGGVPVVAWRGMDDRRRLVATVVRYDAGGVYWVAAVRQERLQGRHEAAELAMVAAEQAHDAASSA
jgi:hypothetical protein